MAAGGSSKAVLAALAGNSAIAVAKFVGFFVTGSGAMLAEGFALRTAAKEALPSKGDLSWWQFIRRSRNPELPVVLLEDSGAMLGLLIALSAVLVSHFTGNAVWDGVGTLCIGLLLLGIAAVLIVEMRSLLLGEGARPREMEALRAAMANAPHVERIVHLRTQYLSPEEMLVGAKLVFTADLDQAELADAINGVEAAVRVELPHARPMYIEPDLDRDPARSAEG